MFKRYSIFMVILATINTIGCIGCDAKKTAKQKVQFVIPKDAILFLDGKAMKSMDTDDLGVLLELHIDSHWRVEVEQNKKIIHYENDFIVPDIRPIAYRYDLKDRKITKLP